MCRLTGGRGAALFSMSNTVSGVNSKCSCPEEGLCGRARIEEDLEELQNEDEEEEQRSVKLCRAGGGGGWDGGRLLNGSSNACGGSRMS